MAALALLAAGCGGSARGKPPPVDVRAIEGYAGAYADPELARRADPAALQTRAQILLDLFRSGGYSYAAKAEPKVRELLQSQVPALKDPSGAQLLSEAIVGFSTVLASPVENGQAYVCATELAGIFRLKLARPELRRAGKGLTGFDEILYRRLMLESIAEYELYALSRHPEGSPLSGERAASALDDLAAAYRALADWPEVRSPAAAYWVDRASRTDARVRQVRSRPGDPKKEKNVNATIEELTTQANADHVKAVERKVGRAGVGLVLEAFEDALRNYFIVGETSSEPPTAIRIDLDELQNTALEP